MMTDKLIEQIKADREAGTPGAWRAGVSTFSYGEGDLQMRVYTDYPPTEFDVCGDNLAANAKRIARVPDMEARILADAEVIKAAEALVSRLNKLQTYFDLTAEEFDSLTQDEQADTIRQHCLITETIEAFNRAKQGRKGDE